MKLELIKELNAEHSILTGLLNDVAVRGILDDDTRRLLLRLRDALVAHLGKEDRELYPALRQAAETNESLRNTLLVMGTEMEELSTLALNSIDSWLSGRGREGFAASFGSFRKILAERIAKEERNLYAKYLKLAAG
jgi:hypothetical protein